MATSPSLPLRSCILALLYTCLDDLVTREPRLGHSSYVVQRGSTHQVSTVPILLNSSSSETNLYLLNSKSFEARGNRPFLSCGCILSGFLSPLLRRNRRGNKRCCNAPDTKGFLKMRRRFQGRTDRGCERYGLCLSGVRAGQPQIRRSTKKTRKYVDEESPRCCV